MSHPRRNENNLESLLRWRRNVFLSTSHGAIVVCYTRIGVGVHRLYNGVNKDALGSCVFTFDEHPDLATIYDGQGWNLYLLCILGMRLGE